MDKKHYLGLLFCTYKLLKCDHYFVLHENCSVCACVCVWVRETCQVELHSQVKRSNLLTGIDRKTTCLAEKSLKKTPERSLQAIQNPIRETERKGSELRDHCCALRLSRQLMNQVIRPSFIPCWSSVAHFMSINTSF